MRIAALLACAWVCVAAMTAAAEADVTLVQDGQAKAVIVVSPEVMAEDAADAAQLKGPAREAELQRQRLRESVKDLALYLQKMSGAQIEIVEGEAPQGDRVPILIGDRARHMIEGAEREQLFEKKAPFKQGFRITVGGDGVELFGESDLATSYAIYTVLDRLGCRWYMPSEMGEVIPQQATITLPEGDESLAPYTHYRTIWYAEDAYKRRNRMGGLALSAGHALEMYLGEQDREEHPDWRATVKGQPHPHRLRWSAQGLADLIADRIIAKHEADPQPTYSLSPDDGLGYDESAEDRALDTGDYDPSLGDVALTDRLLYLCNQIAEKVTAKYPEVRFGMLAYVPYARPPLREKVHPAIVPQIAPITFSRAHPMNMDEVPDNEGLRYIVEGWAKAAKETSYYFYAFFLAETSAPNPMIRKWGHDVPYVFEHGACKFWQPETITNFETSLHALYMGNRLAWDPTIKPQEVFDELHQRFYGAAGEAMAAYWDHIDRVWVETPEYAGAAFGHMRRWTPEAMAEARRLMDAAVAAAQTEQERFRVQMANDSLQQFELFMQLRWDLAEGRFADLDSGSDRYLERARELGRQYEPQAAFGKMHWTLDDTIHSRYFSAFVEATYRDAARLAEETHVLTPTLLEWKWQKDPHEGEGEDKKPQGESRGWQAADFDDSAWPTTNVMVDTWSALGLHNYYESVWYRRGVDLPQLPAGEGKKVYLWIGATDGSAKVFVNGQHVPYIEMQRDESGNVTSTESKEFADGHCRPFSYDITTAVRPGEENQVAILATRTFLNELGTGGLIAPVVIYQEK